MCIRALDYCPPVDITFGEYLRAIITADLDSLPTIGCTTAPPSWRHSARWNILPSDMRTVSEETLAWNTPEQADPQMELAYRLDRDP